MIRMIEGLPSQVVGFEAVGQVESADYENVLDPAVEQALQTHDKLRLLYVLGEEFTGYTGGAMWEDTKLGGEHWRSWEKIAVVTDEAWIGNGVKALGWMIPGQVRVFPTGGLDDAKAWVAE
jgi:hypothetical protein